MSESRKFDYYENVTQNAVSNMNAFQVKDSNWTVSVPVNGATGLSYTPDSRILLMLKQQGAQDKDPRSIRLMNWDICLSVGQNPLPQLL